MSCHYGRQVHMWWGHCRGLIPTAEVVLEQAVVHGVHSGADQHGQVIAQFFSLIGIVAAVQKLLCPVHCICQAGNAAVGLPAEPKSPSPPMLSGACHMVMMLSKHSEYLR